MATPTKKTTEPSVTNIDISDLFAVDPDEAKALKMAMLSPVNANVRYDRKINMGNYESLGIGISVTMPVGLSTEEYAAMERMTRRAIEEANQIAGSEMNDKVRKIKAKKTG